MDKPEPNIKEVLTLACIIGSSIMYGAFDGKFNPMLLYLGIGVAVVGACYKVLTKPGMIILIAGIAGNIFLDSYWPATISAAALSFWWIFDYIFFLRYK